MGSSGAGRTVFRIQLGRQLKARRLAAGKKPEDFHEAKIGSTSKLWRIEEGEVPVRTPDVKAMCELYGITDPETIQRLTALAEAGNNAQGWWAPFVGEVPEWLKLYLDLERTAHSIQTWEGLVVPGELQTPEYAEAVLRKAQPDDDDDVIRRRVKLRTERQSALLSREPAPRMEVVIGEAVLRCQVGGEQVQAAQVQHLRELDRSGAISLRYLPFGAGASAGMTGAFRLFGLDDQSLEIVYLETQVGGHYLEQADEITEYHRVFGLIAEESVPIEEYQ